MTKRARKTEAKKYELNEKTGELLNKLHNEIKNAQAKFETVVLAIRLEKGIDEATPLNLSPDYKFLTEAEVPDGD